MSDARTTGRDSIGRAEAPDRRSVLAGLAAFAGAALGPGLATSGAALAGPEASWVLATQILAGDRPRDPNLIALALDALRRNQGDDLVDRLLAGVLARDADSIAAPFADPAVEAAARRFVEIVYTGAVDTDGAVDAVAFHQALAWQVLRFTKAPGVCGDGFGWWADAPDVA